MMEHVALQPTLELLELVEPPPVASPPAQAARGVAPPTPVRDCDPELAEGDGFEIAAFEEFLFGDGRGSRRAADVPFCSCSVLRWSPCNPLACVTCEFAGTNLTNLIL